MNLVDFPTDLQNLAIKVESTSYDATKVAFYFVSNQAALFVSDEIEVAEFLVRSPKAEVGIFVHSYSLLGNYSRAVFAILLERNVF